MKLVYDAGVACGVVVWVVMLLSAPQHSVAHWSK